MTKPLDKPTIDKSKGTSLGMGVCAYFALLFESNEKLPPKKKMTDEVIAKKMRAEFPDRKSSFFSGKPWKSGFQDTVNQWRQKYNRGNLTRDLIPTICSFRYDEQGQIVDFRSGKYPLLPEEVDLIKQEHAKRAEKSKQAFLKRRLPRGY